MSATLTLERIRESVANVVDPEIPVLTIEDLGILRGVSRVGEKVKITITPTYSGCPAMRQIEDDIVSALEALGVRSHEVVVTHTPAWTTDWLSPAARHKLAEFGIAPPSDEQDVLCPRCASKSPRLVTRFGSTACKAFMVCTSCREPFDWFKSF